MARSLLRCSFLRQYDSYFTVEATLALFNIANPSQYLILYGPFKDNGIPCSQGNVHFDDPYACETRHGVYAISKTCAHWPPNGFSLRKQHPMPANNFTLIWEELAMDILLVLSLLCLIAYPHLSVFSQPTFRWAFAHLAALAGFSSRYRFAFF